MTATATAEAVVAAASADPAVLQPVHESEDAAEVLAMLCGGFLLGLYLMYDGYDTWKTLRLMQDTPTSKVRSMPVGRVELQGEVASHGRTFDPPYHETECVYVDWAAKRREKHTDEDGNTHYTWETVASGTRAAPFDLDDGTGRATVRGDIDAAEFDVDDDDNRHRVTYGRGESPPDEVVEFVRRARGNHPSQQQGGEDREGDGGLLGEVVDTVTDLAGGSTPLTRTNRKRRYTQRVLPVGNETYVLGGAEPVEDASVDAGQQDLLEVTDDASTEDLLVADDPEKELQGEYSTEAPLKSVGGLALSAVTLYLLLSWYAVPLGLL